MLSRTVHPERHSWLGQPIRASRAYWSARVAREVRLTGTVPVSTLLWLLGERPDAAMSAWLRGQDSECNVSDPVHNVALCSATRVASFLAAQFTDGPSEHLCPFI